MTARHRQKSPMALAGELLARQHGVASDAQIRAVGVTVDRQETNIRHELWVRYARGIVAAAGAVPTWHQRAAAATLSAPGAMLYGPTAARLHDLDGFTTNERLEVIVHRRVHVLAIPGVRYRYSRHIDTVDRHLVQSIPVTILPLTLVHLLADGHDAGQALDSALRSGFSPQWLHEHFVRWQHPNIVAARTMVEMLAERVTNRLPLSWFQRLAKQIFDEAGIRLVDEWVVRDANGRRVAQLDLADPDLLVGLECQSWEHHGSPAAQQRDLRRKRKLRKLGWEIVEVWWSDLTRIDDVVADVLIALDRARQRR